MKALAEFAQALRGTIRFRRRSFFMMSGIAVGIASLAMLDSVGENTRRETMKRVKNMLGTFDTVIVRPGGGRTRGMVSLANVEPVLKFSDAQAIAAELAGIKQVGQLQNAFDVEVSYRAQELTPAVFGVSANWLELRGDAVEQGAFWSVEQEQSLARVAVLGSEARKNLFGEETPLQKTIRIGGVPFAVIGTLASRGAGPAGGSLDNLVLIPVTTASKRLFNRDFLTMVIAQLRDPSDADRAVQQITTLLRERHHLAATALDDFTITNPAAVMKQMTNVASTLSRILRGVAWLAMLIGGVVIMSLALIGVSERRKEIGVRRSVGAGRADIVFQFLAEAALVSVAGGAFGIALGLGGANALAAYQKLPLIFSFQSVAQSLALAAAIGLLFGIYPAWRASRVDPIEALRA
ncbi:MAG TPA: ABC transporter permease [Bryobacteraceae bacterium]|nr:ABC transporter permease [Bryobacteraceae bacterium]